MPLTRDQINEIKGVIKSTIVDMFTKDADFIATVLDKAVGDKIKEMNKTTCEKVNGLETQVNLLKGRIIGFEQYNKRKNIRILGLPAKRGENLFDVIKGLFKDRLKIDVGNDDIDDCYRVINKNVHTDESKAIIVKFISFHVKQKVLQSKKLLKGSKIYIYEDLTKQRHNTLSTAINKFGSRNVWTVDGKIKVKYGGKIHTLKSDLDLQTLE